MYSQNDKRWSNLKINGTSSTIGRFGCFVVSLAELAGMPPPEALKLLERGGAFNKDLIISDKAAKALNLDFDPTRRSDDFKPTHTCVVEVDYKPSTPAPDQHFCLAFTDGTIGDPIDGKIKKNPYRVISYRLFKTRENWKDKLDQAEKIIEEKNAIIEETREECARLQKQLDKLEEDHLKELIPMQEDITTLENQIDSLKFENGVLNETKEKLLSENTQLKEEINRLNNIQGLNVEKTSVAEAVKFLLEVIFKK